MKKTLHILYACLAAIGLLASCSQPFAGSGESKAGSGPGTLCLFPAAGTPSGRSIGPASLASEITSYHVILRKATVPVFEQDVEPGASATVSSLETGDYTVIAYGVQCIVAADCLRIERHRRRFGQPDEAHHAL